MLLLLGSVAHGARAVAPWFGLHIPGRPRFRCGPHTCRMLLTTGGAALLIVYVEHTLLEDALAGLLGGASATPLVFEPVIDFRRAETARVVAIPLH